MTGAKGSVLQQVVLFIDWIDDGVIDVADIYRRNHEREARAVYLTAAHDLCVAGYTVHVYEMSDRLGGLMAWGIPAFSATWRAP